MFVWFFFHVCCSSNSIAAATAAMACVACKLNKKNLYALRATTHFLVAVTAAVVVFIFLYYYIFYFIEKSVVGVFLCLFFFFLYAILIFLSWCFSFCLVDFLFHTFTLSWKYPVVYESVWVLFSLFSMLHHLINTVTCQLFYVFLHVVFYNFMYVGFAQ